MHPKTRSWLAQALQDHEGRLLRYAQSLMGDLDRARDVVQDTFLKLAHQQPKQIDGYLTPWLFRVCRNLIIDLQRKEQRMMNQTLDAPSSEQLFSPKASPHDQLEMNDKVAQVMRHLTQLPGNQQEVIRLKFQEELSYKEIAEITQLTESNIGFLIHTGIRRIRKKMEVSS